MTLYNITNDSATTISKTSIPSNNQVMKIPGSKQAVMSFIQNETYNEGVSPKINAIVSPLIFTRAGNLGAFLYAEQV